MSMWPAPAAAVHTLECFQRHLRASANCRMLRWPRAAAAQHTRLTRSVARCSILSHSNTARRPLLAAHTHAFQVGWSPRQEPCWHGVRAQQLQVSLLYGSAPGRLIHLPLSSDLPARIVCFLHAVPHFGRKIGMVKPVGQEILSPCCVFTHASSNMEVELTSCSLLLRVSMPLYPARILETCCPDLQLNRFLAGEFRHSATELLN